jgi:hypothetical protein
VNNNVNVNNNTPPNNNNTPQANLAQTPSLASVETPPPVQLILLLMGPSIWILYKAKATCYASL